MRSATPVAEHICQRSRRVGDLAMFANLATLAILRYRYRVLVDVHATYLTNWFIIRLNAGGRAGPARCDLGTAVYATGLPASGEHLI